MMPPDYRGYQEKTKRVIPLIRLSSVLGIGRYPARRAGRCRRGGAAGTDVQLFALQVEGAGVELVDAGWRLECWASASSTDSDVDGGRNGVDQAVASERGLQALRGLRDSLGDLDQIGVGKRRVAAVDAPPSAMISPRSR